MKKRNNIPYSISIEDWEQMDKAICPDYDEIKEELDELKKRIAATIKVAMIKKNIDVDTLAVLTGLSKETVELFINGTFHPQKKTCKKIAGILGIDPADLLE